MFFFNDSEIRITERGEIEIRNCRERERERERDRERRLKEIEGQ